MDTKLFTFLTVCQTMNYRKTAKLLHLTQPAVTKQIQALEQIFQTKLFLYDGHNLHKTDKCRLLEQYAMTLRYNYEELELAMNDKKRTHLRIGATKTIGDYILGPAMIRYLKVPEHEISLTVDNTAYLLHLLDTNNIDFAIIEGNFSKSKYGHYLFRKEPFIGACSIDSPLCDRTVSMDELCKETLIVREEGSGTRNILESRISEQGYSLSDFERVIPVSGFISIKQLISAGIGVTFLYESVILKNDEIGTFNVDGITLPHELNVVYTKETAAKQYSEQFLEDYI